MLTLVIRAQSNECLKQVAAIQLLGFIELKSYQIVKIEHF